MRTKTAWLSRIFWIDGLAGLSAGIFVLVFANVLCVHYGLPRPLVSGIGLVNLLYSTGGLTLAAKKQRPQVMIGALAFANLAWACVCGVLITAFAGSAKPLGLVVLAFEGVFVTALAWFEWRHRAELAFSAREGQNVVSG